MATEEVKITRKTKGHTWYLQFTGSDGEIRATTKGPRIPGGIRIAAWFSIVLAAVTLVGAIASKSGPLFNTSIAMACLGAAGALLQAFAPIRIEFRTADGFACTSRFTKHP